jgi:hypothetical protein
MPSTTQSVPEIPSTTFNSFHQGVNIVLNKNGFHTLAIIIVNLIQANLLPWSCTTQGFATYDAAQTKEKSYRNWHHIDQFLPLTIEIFGYLHKHVDVFLHDTPIPFGSWKG